MLRIRVFGSITNYMDLDRRWWIIIYCYYLLFRSSDDSPRNAAVGGAGAGEDADHLLHPTRQQEALNRN